MALSNLTARLLGVCGLGSALRIAATPDYMLGMTEAEVKEDYMKTGFWFVVCNAINEAFMSCEEDAQVETYAEELMQDSTGAAVSSTDVAGEVLISETQPEMWMLQCLNDNLKYEVQMYNLYPIFKVLSADA